MELAQQRDGVRTEAVDVIRRHQRDCPDVKIAAAGAADFERRVGGVALRREAERKFCISRWAARANEAVCRSLAPSPQISAIFTFAPGVPRSQTWPMYSFPLPPQGPTGGCRASWKHRDAMRGALVADKWMHPYPSLPRCQAPPAATYAAASRENLVLLA